MAGVEEIRQASDRVALAESRIAASLPTRDSEPGRSAWEAACADFHEEFARFVALVGLDGKLIRRGEASAIERAIAFMEADPQCFRSGYMLANAAYALANAPLSNEDRARLRVVVIDQVERPRARMMRPMGRLAAAVWSDGLDVSLRQLAAEPADLGQLSTRSPRWGRRSRIEVRVACIRAAVLQQRRTEAGGAA